MSRDMDVFTSAAVDAEVEITLYPPRTPDDEFVSILFGPERITLEFYDVESLERLRDLADEGARRLRAVIDANDRSDAAGGGTAAVDLVGTGGRST
jgi:hypothetical protein